MGSREEVRTPGGLLVEVLADPASVASRAAARVIELAGARAHRDPTADLTRGGGPMRGFSIALSGGSTPRRFHEALAARADELDWPSVQIFFSDERAVPPDHVDSNYRMAEETLLSRIHAPAGNIHRVHADDGDADRAAADYELALTRALGPEGAVELVVLGMGEDGHTASLFPGSDPAPGLGDRLVAAAVAPPGAVSPRRVTFTFEALRRARTLLVLVTGATKAKRLAEVLSGGSGLPLARALAGRPPGSVIILADRPAAAELGARFEPRIEDMEEAKVTGQGAQIGVIGLGVMGENLALNIEEHGFSIAVHNRSPEKIDELLAKEPGKKITPAYSLEELAARLARPRLVLIMVKAGAAVDETIAGLLPHLSPGDVVIDGGNEHYPNTERRAKELAARGINFVGMGVSGGEEGARHGPSLMPGCTAAAYALIEPIVTRIAAQVGGEACVTHVGPGGAGHYVKMVHNGIEYGDMQLIAEAYDVLARAGGLSNAELAEVFTEWNAAELESFLIEITASIFRKKDELTGADLVDVILDAAQMKGTGSWTVKDAADLGASIPTIASSVDARVISAGHELRQKGAKVLRGPEPSSPTTPPRSAAAKAELVLDVRRALYAAKACSYAQGLGLLAKASATYGWGLRLGEIARIWKGGCIIRAAFLGRIQAAYTRDAGLENLLFDPEFSAELAARQDGWRRTVVCAVERGIAVPTLTASLAYYDSLRRARLPTNLIQAQRDLFGAHTFRRIDREGTFHADWKPTR